jgi:hypothetical protein
MNIPERHEMTLETTHPTGAEEWYCPICGRRFMVQWSPTFNMVILEPGDPKAAHNGSTGGLRIGPPRVTKTDGTEPPEGKGLRAWIEGLEDIDLTT